MLGKGGFMLEGNGGERDGTGLRPGIRRTHAYDNRHHCNKNNPSARCSSIMCHNPVFL
jgi:hypothetical protein